MSSAGYLEVNSDPVFWTMLNAIKDLKKKDMEIASVNKKLIAKDAEIAALKAGNAKLARSQEVLAGKHAAGNVVFSMIKQK